MCLNVSSDLPGASHNHHGCLRSSASADFLDILLTIVCIYMNACICFLCYGIVDKAAKIAQILVLRHPLLFRSLVQRKSEDLG